jgi:hypothetical protein
LSERYVAKLIVELEKYERLGGGEHAQHEAGQHDENKRHFNEMDLAYARAVGLYKLNPVLTHSLKAPGFKVLILQMQLVLSLSSEKLVSKY